MRFSKCILYKCDNSKICCLWPYPVENSGSCPITEVKQRLGISSAVDFCLLFSLFIIHIFIIIIKLFLYFHFFSLIVFCFYWGWSGGAMVLGKLSVPGRPTIWVTVGQGPTALAVGAGGGCLDIFTLIYHFFPLSPSLWETAWYRLKYCLKGPLNPKPTNQPTNLFLLFLYK